MRATIKDVAREAGVSVSTVSYVLSRKGEVIKDSHKRVLEAVEKLGYIPSATARSLVHRRTNCVGVVVPNATVSSQGDYNPFIGWVIAQYASELSKRGCWMSLCMHDSNDLTKVEEFVTSANVDGFLWFAFNKSSTCVSISDRRGLPHVGVYAGRPSDNSHIISENLDSIDPALQHLLDLGHTKIMCINGSATHDLRGEAYRAMIERTGFDYQRELTAYYDENGAYTAMSRYIDSGDELPTAIFATSDYMALGVLRALADHGIKVPEDISVIGYDDIFSARYANPPLTTVKQRISEVARLSVDYVLEWRDAHEPGPGLSVHVPPELVVRKSTAAPRQV